MSPSRALANLLRSGPLVRDAAAARSLGVFASLLGPAWRGLYRRRAALPRGLDVRDVAAVAQPLPRGGVLRGALGARADAQAVEQAVLDSEFMGLFRRTMLKRIIPNLKRIGLLSDRIRPRYEALGLLVYEDEQPAPELTAKDLLEG